MAAQAHERWRFLYGTLLQGQLNDSKRKCYSPRLSENDVRRAGLPSGIEISTEGTRVLGGDDLVQHPDVLLGEVKVVERLGERREHALSSKHAATRATLSPPSAPPPPSPLPTSSPPLLPLPVSSPFPTSSVAAATIAAISDVVAATAAAATIVAIPDIVTTTAATATIVGARVVLYKGLGRAECDAQPRVLGVPLAPVKDDLVPEAPVRGEGEYHHAAVHLK